PFSGLERLSEGLELSAGLPVSLHSLVYSLVTLPCPLMVLASLSCCKRRGWLPWVSRCFARRATAFPLHRMRFNRELLPIRNTVAPPLGANQAMHRTTGLCLCLALSAS